MNSLKLSSFYLLLTLLISCEDNHPEEAYSVEPHIEFEKVEFIDSPANPDYPGYENIDTIKLTFNFTDGDADFGFKGSVSHDSPYNERFYFLRSTGERVPSKNQELFPAKNEDFLKYSDRHHPPFDSLPEFNKASACLNWQIIGESNQDGLYETIDTLYFQLNPNHYNLDIDFMVKQADGSYLPFDFRTLCVTYDTRISYDDRVYYNNTGYLFDIQMLSPFQGKVVYKMTGVFVWLFAGKQIKLKFFIRDRGLHKSNISETTDISIPG